MKPDRFEHELSEFIDGRLPSGRREQALAHIDTDPNAERLLEEMSQASDLARSLPPVTVSSDFAATLWERIRTGEGTPEAVFREPLSWWTKARYVATGAAAAAVALAAINLLGRQDVTPQDGGVSAPQEVAEARTPGGLRPYNPYPYLNVAQIMPETVARAGRLECVDAVAALQTRASDVERQLDNSSPRDIVDGLDPMVGRVRGSTHLIRWMQREKMVELPAEFDTALSLTEGILERMHLAGSANDRSQLRVVVHDLKQLRVDRLQRSFNMVCCREPQEFQALLQDQIMLNPDVRGVLRIEIVRSDSLGGPSVRMMVDPLGTDPLGSAVLILRDPCAPPPTLRLR